MIPRLRRLLAASVAVAAAAALAACSSPGPTTSTPAATSITVTDAFGDTTLPAKPKRVVTLGWGSTEAAIAIGVVPVAIGYQAYGGDKDGVLPWVQEAVDKLGVDLPTVLPNSEEPPYEAIAAAKPDLILAPYSGLTAEQDKLLKAIAPTVAYPKEPWATPWRDVIDITGKALGEPDKAASVVADVESKIKAAADAHPEFQGKSIALVWDGAGTFYVYRKEDPRVQFAFDLGFVNAPAVDELANGDSTFYYTLSYEKLSQLKSDVLLSFSDDKAANEKFLAGDGAVIPAVKAGHVAQINGAALISAVSPPTALSVTWGLDEYVAALADAVKG